MDSCLRIPEILLTIFENVLFDNAQSAEGSTLDRRGILALVKTCRTFSGPALQVLWRTIYNPIPLLLTMPRDLLNIEIAGEHHGDFGRPRTLTFKREPSPRDWERFDAYAPFVQKMGFLDQKSRSWTNFLVLSHRICRVLAQRSLQTALLPGLQSVNVFSNDLPYIAFFLTPDVRNIRLVMSPDYITSLSILAAEIPLRAPNLQTLQLVESTAWTTPTKRLFKPGLSKLLYTLNLQAFSCDFFELDDELMWCLLTMPRLHVMDIHTGLHTLKTSLLTHRLKEPRITSFCLSCDSFRDGALGTVTSLLRPSNLTTLEITFIAASSQPPAEELSEFIAAIGKYCSPGLLTDFKLDTSGTHPSQATMQAAAITFDMLIPLLPFSQLRNFTFSAHPLELTDDETKQLAMSWPLLETLCVNTDPLFGPPPRTSLKGLLWLATFCRKLKSLEFRFSETCGMVLSEEMGAAASHGLSFLSVGSSLIENPDKVARFLTCVFPTMSLLMFSHPLEDVNTDRWNEVQAQIQCV